MEEATARADLIYSGTKDGEILHRGADTNVGRNLWHPHTGIPQPTLIYQTDVIIVQLGWGEEQTLDRVMTRLVFC
jgi:hypothetical protein